ncbi:uncharacterized protein METZ01_LOCUS410508, partial [marine metagenome]
MTESFWFRLVDGALVSLEETVELADAGGMAHLA